MSLADLTASAIAAALFEDEATVHAETKGADALAHASASAKVRCRVSDAGTAAFDPDAGDVEPWTRTVELLAAAWGSGIPLTAGAWIDADASRRRRWPELRVVQASLVGGLWHLKCIEREGARRG